MAARPTWGLLAAAALLTVAAAGTGSVPGPAAAAVDAPSADDHESDSPTDLRPGQVVTVAGGGDADDVPDGGDARDLKFTDDVKIDVDADGQLYIIADWDERVWAVEPGGQVRALVRDDGSAPFEPGHHPQAVAVGEQRTVLLGGAFGVIRPEPDGTFTTVASADQPDSTPAGFYASDLAAGAGGIYVADRKADRVYRIDTDGNVTAIAGGGDRGLEDSAGGPATEAKITSPTRVASDSAGNVYIVHETGADGETVEVVRQVAPDGTISTVTGLNPVGFDGDGGPVTQARFGAVIAGIAVDSHDRLYIADHDNSHVRRVDPDGTVTTVGPAVMGLDDVAVSPAGELYASTPGQVRKISLVPDGDALAGDCATETTDDGDRPADPWADEEPGTLVTLTAQQPDSSGAERTELVLDRPSSATLHVDDDGVVYLADVGRLLRITPDGTITPVAGDPDHGHPLEFVRTMTTGDDVLYAAAGNSVVKVYPDGEVVTVGGGSPTEQAATDGHRAYAAHLNAADLACGPDDGLLVADLRSGRLLALQPDGTVATVADEFTDADNGGRVNGIDVGPDGRTYVVAYGSANDGVYRVDAPGETVPLTGDDAAALDEEFDDIDGEAAADVHVALFNESDVAVGPDDAVYVSTHGGIHRVADGTITTVLEKPRGEHGGFSGSPQAAGLAFDPHGNLYFVDPEAERVRVLVRPGALGGNDWTLRWALTGAVVLVLASAAVIMFLRRGSRAQ